MNTRKCSKCGWEVPLMMKGAKCPVCKTPWDTAVCYRCGRLVSGAEKVPKKAECKKCHNEVDVIHNANSRARRYAKTQQRWDDWLKKVHMVPRDYKPLTEAQWLDACKYFGGCAICGSKDIDARSLLINPDFGGRYCDWNVVPTCLICERHYSNKDNIFTVTIHRDQIMRSTKYRHQLDKIVAYLEPKLDAAIKEAIDE